MFLEIMYLIKPILLFITLTTQGFMSFGNDIVSYIRFIVGLLKNKVLREQLLGCEELTALSAVMPFVPLT